MNNLKKIVAFLLAIVVVASLAGCSAVPKSMSAQWGYKTDAKEYPIGVYIYALFSAYNKAYSTLQNSMGEDFKENESIIEIESTFDETGEKLLCGDWIEKEADKIVRNLIALDEEIAKNEIELDKETVDAAYEQAKKDWNLGSYYEEYLSYGYSATPYKTMLEPYGVSFESFYVSTYLASVKQNALFDHLYGEGGTKEVSLSEQGKYFEENYTSYAYFTAALSESSTDEEGDSITVALPDSEVNAIKTQLSKYVVDINEKGQTMAEVSESYQKFAKLENDPLMTQIENLDDTSIGDEVAEGIEKLAEGKADIVYVGEKNSMTAYLIYKEPIKSETEDYLEDGTNTANILQAMKGDEFLDFVDSLTDTVTCTVNSKVVAKFKPVMFEDKLEDMTEGEEETAE